MSSFQPQLLPLRINELSKYCVSSRCRLFNSLSSMNLLFGVFISIQYPLPRFSLIWSTPLFHNPHCFSPEDEFSKSSKQHLKPIHLIDASSNTLHRYMGGTQGGDGGKWQKDRGEMGGKRDWGGKHTGKGEEEQREKERGTKKEGMKKESLTQKRKGGRRENIFNLVTYRQ